MNRLAPYLCLVGWLLVGMPGCRFAYEISDGEDTLGSKGASLAGARGDGDSQEVSGALDAAGGNPSGNSASIAEGSGGGETGSGGSGAGSSGAGGSDSTGGAGTGGAGTGGAGTGGAGTGGAGTGGAGTGGAGTGGAGGDYHVTSSAGDAGPGTFRNAIDQAIAAGTHKTITFDPGLTIVMNQRIPPIATDMSIIGDSTHLDFSSAGNGHCFEIDGGTFSFDGLEVSGCGANPFFFNAGTNHQVTNSYFHDNGGSITTGPSSLGTTIGPGNRIANSGGHCVFLNAPGDQLIDNEISDCGGNGVFFGSTSDGSFAIGNLILRANAGMQFGTKAANITIRYNTIARSSGQAITIGQASNMTVQNNILSHSSGFGVNGNQANFASLSHNLYFMNALGNCNGCTPGAGAKVDVDPSYVDFAGDVYWLAEGSPAIDEGLDTGEDRNGSDPGTFWGTAPDLGYRETNF